MTDALILQFIPLFLAIAGAFATVIMISHRNRQEISRVKDSLYGHDREREGNSTGVVQELDEISEKLDCIEDKIDEERKGRERDHQRMREEVRTNRHLTVSSVNELVNVIYKETDADVSPEEVKPDWVGTEMDPFDDDYRDDG